MNTENQLENFEKLPSLFYTKLPRIIRKKEFQKQNVGNKRRDFVK